jgi:hypothetical protein
VQLFGLSLVNQKYHVIPLMHCQYIVSIYNGINKCAGLFAKKLTASQKIYIGIVCKCFPFNVVHLFSFLCCMFCCYCFCVLFVCVLCFVPNVSCVSGL